LLVELSINNLPLKIARTFQISALFLSIEASNSILTFPYYNYLENKLLNPLFKTK